MQNNVIHSRVSEGQAPSNLNKKLVAFTLAEVLITLAIIGVVASLTIANVMKGYKKQVTVAKLKTAYGTLSRVLQTAEAEKGSIGSWFSSGDVFHNTSAERVRPILDNFANNYMIPYMNVVDSGRKNIREFGYKKGILYPNGDIMPAIAEENYEIMGMQLANGMFITIVKGTHSPKEHKGEMAYQSFTRVRFLVDIDGPKHGPGVLGKDVFVFEKYLSSDPRLAHLQLFGLLDSTYNPTSKTFYNISYATRSELLDNCKTYGNYCGALIMQDGWRISSDYPWF